MCDECDHGWRSWYLVLALALAACDGGSSGADATPGDRDAAPGDTDATATWGGGCDPRPGDQGVIDDEGNREFLDFEIRGTGFEAHEGAAIRAMTFVQDEPTRIYGASEVTVEGGTFEIAWIRGYQRFMYQTLVLYVDVDGDGMCDPANDVTWGQFSSAHNPTENEPYVWEIGLADFQPIEPAAACASLDRCSLPE